jgi:hypothetical protein
MRRARDNAPLQSRERSCSRTACNCWIERRRGLARRAAAQRFDARKNVALILFRRCPMDAKIFAAGALGKISILIERMTREKWL